MDPNSLIQRSADLIVAEMDGELVMMDVTQGSYFAINQVGAHLWEKLESPQTPADLTASVHQAFAVEDRAQVDTDVAVFLADLAKNNLIREVAP